eukprot:1158953-Pelagomonas_calceolata.AAC.4
MLARARCSGGWRSDVSEGKWGAWHLSDASIGLACSAHPDTFQMLGKEGAVTAARTEAVASALCGSCVQVCLPQRASRWAGCTRSAQGAADGAVWALEL